MRKIKIRFNLGKGENFMKWKIDFPVGKNSHTTQYFEPKEWQIVLKKCILKNNIKTATKIFKGANKEVCAWILADKIQLNSIKQKGAKIKILKKYEPVSYNPRITPHWVYKDVHQDGANIETIISKDKKLFVKY